MKISLPNLPNIIIQDSESLRVGDVVLAIGNPFDFGQTVTKGIISAKSRNSVGLNRYENFLQTDAAINRGNSGGPLLNLAGEVIGINTATVLDAQSIGFAIPANKVKRDIAQVKATGEITYALLGIRYSLITDSLQESEGLPVDYGAYIQKGASGEPGVISGSAAEDAGLLEGDIILEFDGERITTENTLAKMIQKQEPGEQISLRVLRDDEELTLQAILGERDE